MTNANTAVWFEIPAADFGRAVRFYETVFATRLKDEVMPGSTMRMGIFPTAGDGVTGCVIAGEGYAPSAQGAVVYLNGGPDLSVPLSRVEAAGGTVLVPKTPISEDIGWFAQFLDSEGNRVGLHSMA